MLSSLQVRYTSTWAMMLIVVGFGFMLIVASRTGLSAAYPDPHAIKFEERLQTLLQKQITRVQIR